MKKVLLSALGLGLFLTTSCLNEDGLTVDEYKKSQANKFDFSTITDVNVNIQYLNEDVKYENYFEIYDENPVVDLEYKVQKKDSITPIYAGYTNANGVFSKTIKMPTYCSKVYVYSPDLNNPRVMEGTVENGVLTVTEPAPLDLESAPARNASTKQWSWGSYDSYMAEGKGTSDGVYDGSWKTWLGTYSKSSGKVNYTYTGTDERLKISASEAGEIYTAHQQVIYSQTVCPEEYRCYADLTVTDSAEVAVTFIGGNTCWNSSIGYYYYKVGEAPTSLSDANVIMLFPNTQNGNWENGWQTSQETKGISTGTTVQLKYYPNIKSGSQEGATTIFPKGYKIGFVLACNAWSNRVNRDFAKSNKKDRSATTQGLSVDVNGNVATGTKTAAYVISDINKTVISFEDHDDDENFSDVVIAVSSNPVKAITNLPEVDPETKKTTVKELGGVYAYEDLWPYKGDYDMNDVIIRYEREKVFGPDDLVYQESAMFTLFQNFAQKTNSIGIKVENDNGTRAKLYKKAADATEYTEVTGFTYDAANNVYVITTNVEADVKATYKLVLDYGEDGVTKASSLTVKPFIFRISDKTANKWLEVHIPMEAPTSNADMSLFGLKSADDCSDIEKGIYYVRIGNYPFAFFLSGQTEDVLKAMLDPDNESATIDKLFPRYTNWVTSSGKEDSDWYLSK